MKIQVPAISEQNKAVVIDGTHKAIGRLRENLNAPEFAPQTEVDESQYNNTHLLCKSRYESPHPDIVGAYFRHFQSNFPEYKTDKALAGLLGLSSDRRIREYKQGARKIPYEVWDRFLVITGRKPQEIIEILGFMS